MEIKKDKMETGWKSCENVRLVKVDDDVMRQLHVETEPRVESAPGKPTANGTWSTHYGTGIIVARTCISGGVDIKEESSGTPQPQVHSRIFGVIFTWLDFTLNSCSHHLRAFSRNNPLICPITGLSEFANAKSSFSGCQSAQLMLLCLIAFLPWADTKMNFPSYSFLFILTFSSFLCRYYWKSERIEENGWLKSESWLLSFVDLHNTVLDLLPHLISSWLVMLPLYYQDSKALIERGPRVHRISFEWSRDYPAIQRWLIAPVRTIPLFLIMDLYFHFFIYFLGR